VVENLNQDKSSLQSKLDDYRIENERITNQMLFFQGHIRVLCRIKSQLKGILPIGIEDDDSMSLHYKFDAEQVDFSGKLYRYDRVFEPFTSNTEVFEEVNFIHKLYCIKTH
jgi:hypothetical protein